MGGRAYGLLEENFVGRWGLEPKDESVEAAESEEESMEEAGEEESGGREERARLSVTQSDDPRSGGHFAVGMSKPPL